MYKKDLISIGEAAEMINVSIDTLRRWDSTGKLSPFKSFGGHRLYSRTQIEFHLNGLVNLAQEWILKGVKIQSEYYCSSSSIFQARLSTMQTMLTINGKLEEEAPLIGAVAGEIGINSFDHNIGNWPDEPGVFFGYDTTRKIIVLADRGQGVLTTLKRARSELNSDADALRVAFSEVVSGRAPENRGNGLKFVRQVISENPMGIIFQSGNAVLTLVKDGSDLKIDYSPVSLRGCLVLVTF